MPETNNALAKLSEQLKNYHSQGPVIDKARRIIAELAKVSDGRWDVVCDGPEMYICKAGSTEVQCCIGVCLSIAEEGSEK